MKRSLMLLLLAAAAVPALRGLSHDDATIEAPLVIRTLSPDQKTEILSASSQILNHSVNFRGDGTASTVYLGSQATTEIEWRGLVLRQLVTGTVSEVDRENGIENRYYAQIDAQSFRMLRDGRWGAWKSGLCPFFPGFILVEEVDGQLRASAPKLARFHPGPDVNSSDPARPLMPHERLFAQR